MASSTRPSPDGKWIQFSEHIVNGGSDRYLLASGQPSAPIAMRAMTDTGNIGDAFSDDSRYVLSEIMPPNSL